MSESDDIIGFGGGAVLAFFISYLLNHSILWAIFHCILGWWYLLYAAFARHQEIAVHLEKFVSWVKGI